MSSGGRIYFFKPLPIPPPYKQHWERKKEEEDLTQKEEADKLAAREASVEFTKCSHSESMFDEGSGICMSCGVFLGTCFAPLSANTSGIPGAHHHAFSSAATSSATRKKKLQAANASAASSAIVFINQQQTHTPLAVSSATSSSLRHHHLADDKETTPNATGCENSCTTNTTSSAVFPLFYEGQKIVIFNGIIPVYTPQSFSFTKNSGKTSLAAGEGGGGGASSSSLVATDTTTTTTTPLSDLKKKAFISYMHRISQEAFSKINTVAGDGDSSLYHPLDHVITTGIYSFTGYGFCRHSISFVNANKKKNHHNFTTYDLNKEIIDAIPLIVEEDFDFYSSKRRRTQISLFVAIITAHIFVVHGKDTKSIQECLDIQRLRAKVKASLISKETQSSFYHAIGSRLGVDSKCSGRLVQDAYDMYIANLSSSKDSPKSSSSPSLSSPSK